MIKHTKQLLAARIRAHGHFDAARFDTWILPLLIDSLEPLQAEIVKWLLIGSGPPIPTAELCELLNKTPQQVGSALSDLRKVGLVTTTYRNNDGPRYACHDLVAWMKAAKS